MSPTTLNKQINLDSQINEFLNNISPSISRWMGSSDFSMVNRVRKIVYSVTQMFYVAMSERLNLKVDYFKILKEIDLKKYNLVIGDFPEINNITDIGNALSNIRPIEKHNEWKAALFFEILHLVFLRICSQLDVNPKSDIHKFQKPMNIKLYEIKLFIFYIEDLIAKLKNDNELCQIILYGGLPGIINNVLNQDTRQFLTKTKGVNRNSVPKNNIGSFFTPDWITEYINIRALNIWEKSNQVNKNNISSSRKIPNIADLASGLGSFTDKFVDEDFLNKILSNTDISVPILKDITNHVYCYDLNGFYIDILKLNHSILNDLKFKSIPLSNFTERDTLTTPPFKKFDILIGNPPWGISMNKKSISKIIELKPFINKQFDSYSLFTIRNILSLNENGVLYLVLPETLLLNPNYVSLREYIANNTRITEIIHLGENIFPKVNMPSIIIGITNKKPNKDHLVKIITDLSNKLKKELRNGERDLYNIIHKPINLESQELIGIKLFERKQAEFKSNDGYIFDIFVSNEEKEKLDHLTNADTYILKDLVENSRGVEIGKKGRILKCNKCGNWTPIPHWTLDSKSGYKYTQCNLCKKRIFLNKSVKEDRIIIDYYDGIEKILGDTKFDYILLGENVNKYFSSGKSIIKLGYKGLKYKPRKTYKVPKIILRKTSQKIAATIDYQGYLTIQVVYQFSLIENFRNFEYMLEYIYGILISNIIEQYYTNKHQYRGRKNFPHHIQTNILNLPIPKVDFNDIDSPSTIIALKIAFFSMILMFMAQMGKIKKVDDILLAKLRNFYSKNRDIIEDEIFEFFYKTLSCNIEDLLKNPTILKQPFFKIKEVEEELDKYVKEMFGLK